MGIRYKNKTVLAESPSGSGDDDIGFIAQQWNI
jgi:hypothetical protein